ncbi:hypothetical protein FLM48_06825 [Shewanella sp. Scap07]|uniref:DUF6979 family protein n=1 Tax=Shewanella sp. Scap07 TaxID=2589987 RepID=UPI0015B9EF25|nr:hypothetical protein [Shewanella sp. Scap07]QLE84823.1 hypothetical protein FLM48_06825 [Shewanella sp. Scap07]
MSNYGIVAIEAVQIAKSGIAPDDAWQLAVEKEFTSLPSIKKSCPKNAFLGLAEDGCIKGISSGSYTKSRDNKSYSLNALGLLRLDTALAQNKKELWKKSCNSNEKTHNGQMDVVIELWKQGLVG